MSEVASFLPARRYASAGTSHVPVSVCLSVTSRSSIETDERIELVFGMAASFHLHYVKRKFGYFQNQGTSLWKSVLNSGLRKCCFRIIIDR